MTEGEMYRGALDVVRERGWTQGHYIDKEGRVCLIGACQEVTSDSRLGLLAIVGGLSEVLREHFGTDRVAYANDRLMTSQAEAEAMLEQAAIQAEEQGR